MRKTYILIVISLLFVLSTQAQDNKLIAQSEYYAAEDAYGQGDNNACLEHLKKAEDLVGNNRLIQYLRVKAYYSGNNYEATKRELSVFFDVVPSSYSDDPRYKEMVALISDVNSEIEKKEDKYKANIKMAKLYLTRAKEQLKLGDNDAANGLILELWNLYHKSLKSEITYDQLIQECSSELAALRKANTDPNMMFDERQNLFFKTVTIGNQTWMAQNMLDIKLDGILSYRFDNNQYLDLNYGSMFSPSTYKLICPKGWHFPAISDWTMLFSYLIGQTYDFSFKKVHKSPQTKVYYLLNQNGFNLDISSGYFDIRDNTYNKSKYHLWDDRTMFGAIDGTITITDWNKNHHMKIARGTTTIQIDSDGLDEKGRQYCRCIKD